MTIRSLKARLARIEERVPEPRVAVVYRACFDDGSPLWEGTNEDPRIALAGESVVIYRAAIVDDPETGSASARIIR